MQSIGLLVAGFETTIGPDRQRRDQLLARHPAELGEAARAAGARRERGRGVPALRRPDRDHRARAARGRGASAGARIAKDTEAVALALGREPRPRAVPGSRSLRRRAREPTSTSRSAAARTSASARTSRAWRRRTRSARSSPGPARWSSPATRSSGAPRCSASPGNYRCFSGREPGHAGRRRPRGSARACRSASAGGGAGSRLAERRSTKTSLTPMRVPCLRR